MSEYILYLSFWVWATSLRMFLSSSVHLPANLKVSLFYCCVALHCINVSHFLYPFLGCFLVFIHLGCFWVLAIMNNVTMNRAEQMSLWYECSSFGICPKVAFLGLEVDWFLIFWEITILISTAAVHICTPISNRGVFPLLHILSSISCHQCLLILVILISVRC